MFTYKHYVPSLAPPWGQNPYPGDHQIYNFGRGLPALHHYAFSFSQTCAVVKKKIFENWSLFSPPTPGPRGARDLKFTIYVPLVPKMLHTKFEKNWTGSYQEEVKNVQLLTHFINDHFGPTLIPKPLPLGSRNLQL